MPVSLILVALCICDWTKLTLSVCVKKKLNRRLVENNTQLLVTVLSKSSSVSTPLVYTSVILSSNQNLGRWRGKGRLEGNTKHESLVLVGDAK